MDTTSLLTAALQLPDLWRVPGVEFRDGADVKRKLRITEKGAAALQKYA